MDNCLDIGPVSPALPPRGTIRWTARRKAEIVAAVEDGIMTDWEAAERYRLGAEEFHEWRNACRQGGIPALRVTHAQQSRREAPSAIAV